MATLTDLILAHPLVAVRLVFLCSLIVTGFATALITEPELRADVLAALTKAQWTIQAAAAQIGMSRQRLGHQLDGTDPLTALARLWLLDGFPAAFIDVSAPRFGVVVVQHQALAEILTHLQDTKKAMARMDLSTRQQESA